MVKSLLAITRNKTGSITPATPSRIWRFLPGLAILALAPCAANALGLSASVDKTELAIGEEAILTIKLVDGDTRLRAEGINPNVDLSMLSKHFDFGPPQTEHRFKIDRGRGRPLSILTVTLFPRHAGNIRIPAFLIAGQSTRPIMLHVHEQDPAMALPAFVRIETSKTRIWVNEALTVYLDLYYRSKLKSAKIGSQLTTIPPVGEIHKLAASERQAQTNGFTYDVLRTAWTLFPAQAGKLTVRFPDLWVVIANGRRIHLPAKDQTIAVQALPADVGSGILVGTPTLSRQAIKSELRVNELSSWRVTITAPVSKMRLPGQLPVPDDNADYRIFVDRPERRAEISTSGYTAIADYIFSLVPMKEGRLVLPALHLPYFDTQSATVRIVSVPAQTLTVTAGRAPEQVPNDTPVGPSRLAAPAGSGSETAMPWWSLTMGLFAFLWITTWLWLRRKTTPRRINNGQPARNNRQLAPHSTDQTSPWPSQLRAALGHQSLEVGLREWEARCGPDKELRAVIYAVQAFCYGAANAIGEDKIEHQVIRAVEKIGQATPEPAARHDPWSPLAFTAYLRNRSCQQQSR